MNHLKPQDMKNLYPKLSIGIVMMLTALLLALAEAKAQNVFIPDTNFRTFLQTNYPSCIVGPNQDSLDTQCSAVLNEDTLDVGAKHISDLSGLEYFQNLKALFCYSNSLIFGLPSLPNSLTILFCSNSLLSSLPILPNSLTVLNCSSNQLTSLPSLPNSLISIDCSFNQLTSLPNLPNSLTSLFCGINQLTSLPILPNSLTTLSCLNNLLASLPSLPNSLISLGCNFNQLTSLPSLPISLTDLNCSNNQLASLPSLPNLLYNLGCSSNQLTSLPSLPNSLTGLDCRFNHLACLPTLPSSLNFLSIPITVNCISNINSNMIIYSDTTFSGINLSGIIPICTPANSLCQYANVSGIAYHDANQNCAHDTGELLFKNKIIEFTKNGTTYYAATDSVGYYYANLDTGTYSVNQVQNSPNLNITCSNVPYTVILTTANNSASNIDFPNNADSCMSLSVDIATPRQRVGVSNNGYYVQYCNNGVDTVHNAYIEIVFDPEVIPMSSTLPWSASAAYTYTFTIGSIAPQDCGRFIITDSVNVNALMNQAACATARIFPIDSTCFLASAGANWDGSYLKVSGVCNGASIDFSIENIGSSAMALASSYTLYENDTLASTTPFPALAAGASHAVSIPSNGKTYRVQVPQSIDAPGFSIKPNAIIELCGTGTPVTGHVTSTYMDDADPFVETSCIELVNSYDPNDKQVMPKGFSNDNIVYEDDVLIYMIRFQNTGNDTAYKVTISDTLDIAHLDITTIEPGVSSHPYEFKLWGNSEAIFIFNNINLLPASIDSMQSQGFVKFKIRQKPNNAPGTDIDNKAYIFFDYNTPIITNTANVEIYQAPTITSIGKNYTESGLVLYPNPFTNEVYVSVNGTYKQVRFELYDLVGRSIANQTGGLMQKINFNREQLSSGAYLYKVYADEELIGSGKMIAK